MAPIMLLYLAPSQTHPRFFSRKLIDETWTRSVRILRLKLAIHKDIYAASKPFLSTGLFSWMLRHVLAAWAGFGVKGKFVQVFFLPSSASVYTVTDQANLPFNNYITESVFIEHFSPQQMILETIFSVNGDGIIFDYWAERVIPEPVSSMISSVAFIFNNELLVCGEVLKHLIFSVTKWLRFLSVHSTLSLVVSTADAIHSIKNLKSHTAAPLCTLSVSRS